MNSATKSPELPGLIATILSDPQMPVDNILARPWKTMAIPTMLSRVGINKRSGLPAPDVMYDFLKREDVTGEAFIARSPEKSISIIH